MSAESGKSKQNRVKIGSINDVVPKRSMSLFRKVGPVGPIVDKKFWLAKYHYFAYAVFFLDVIGIGAYLCFIAYHMHDTVMYVEYSRSVIWLNLNTYSLFSPFATLPVLIMLTYHVRNHMRLKDGDYFGLQAVFAILIALLVHDATKLVEGRNFMADLITEYSDEVNSSRIEDLQSLYDAFYKEVRVLRPRKPPSTYKEIPIWIQEFQRDNECCGVNGAEDWHQYVAFKRFTEVPWSCCCKSTQPSLCHDTISCDILTNDVAQTRKGCAELFWRILMDVYEGTFAAMFLLAALHCLCIVAYTVHWLAMRKLVPDESDWDVHPNALINVAQRRATVTSRGSQQKTSRHRSIKTSGTSVTAATKLTDQSVADLDPNISEMIENEETLYVRLFGRRVKKSRKYNYIP